MLSRRWDQSPRGFCPVGVGKGRSLLIPPPQPFLERCCFCLSGTSQGPRQKADCTSVAPGRGLTVCIAASKFPNVTDDTAKARSTFCVAFPAVLQQRPECRGQIRVAPSGPCRSHGPRGSARFKPGWEVGSRRGVPPRPPGVTAELLRMQIPRLSCWTLTRRTGVGLSGAVSGDSGAQLGLGSFIPAIWEAETPGK